MTGMADGVLSAPATRALAQLGPRRFELLLICLRLPRPFTTTDIRAALSAPTTSLARDLGALEEAGLILGSPGSGEARQGRPILYVAQPAAARDVLVELLSLLDDALISP